jgi:hypothetical protein
MRIKDFGLKESVYKNLTGKLMIESKDIAEVLFFTKYIGNYNINKISDYFVFENENYALTLERV